MTQARLAVEAGILTQSARALKAIVGLIWGWLLVIPFPLRAALILAGLVLSLSWGLRGAVPSVTDGALRLSMAALVLLGTLLLIPAGEMSLWRRRHRNQPATWAYAYGESLESAVCSWEARSDQLRQLLVRPRRLSSRWALGIALVVVVSWNLGPCIGEGRMVGRLVRGASWWASLEEWVVTDRWTSDGLPAFTIRPLCGQAAP